MPADAATIRATVDAYCAAFSAGDRAGYVGLFAIIFAEPGLVLFPFLPGDSILFISGTVVAVAGLNVHVLVALLIVAAMLYNKSQA